MRPRKHRDDNKLPTRVYKGKSAYEFRPKDGGCIRLCDLDTAISVIWRKYEKLIADQPKASSYQSILNKYLDSEQFRSRAKETQKGYLKHAKITGQVFGHMLANNIEPKHIRRYLDKRGLKSKHLANHEVRFLSTVFSWAFERGYVKANPKKGVKLFTEKPRDRYIEDHEYQAVYDHATPMMKTAMEIAYRCAARRADIIKLTVFDLKPQGIYIWQQKTGKKQIKEWTTELRKAIELVHTDKSEYIIHTTSNGKYSPAGFDSMWKRARATARKETGMKLDFTFHDLKAKGISDFEGDKRKFSGHSSDKMVAIYNRKTEVVPSLGSSENPEINSSKALIEKDKK